MKNVKASSGSIFSYNNYFHFSFNERQIRRKEYSP